MQKEKENIVWLKSAPGICGRYKGRGRPQRGWMDETRELLTGRGMSVREGM